MKKYKHITIIEQKDTYVDRTVYDIVNNKSGAGLAVLYYYEPWKKYVFTQYDSPDQIIFDNSCLRDIIDFLENEIP
jgi:hypothetical protein